MENQTTKPIVKSQFVTVFAWIMIVINGFGTVMLIVENLVFALFFPAEEFRSALDESLLDMPKGIPIFFIKNISWLIPLLGVLFLFALIASVGLLKRKEWARISVLFFLGLGIIGTLFGTIFQISFFNAIFKMQGMPAEFNSFSAFFIIFMIIISLGFIILYGWLFKKLSSPTVKEEFNLHQVV